MFIMFINYHHDY